MTILQNKLPRSGDLAVNEDLYFADCHRMCADLVAIRKEGAWEHDYKDFYTYAEKRLGLSKTRAKLMLNFVHFTQMCRENRMRLPDSLECVQDVLRLSQKRWLIAWQYCIDYADGPITPGHVKATLEHHDMSKRRKPPQAALDNMAAKRAEKALAGISNPENVKRTGRDWPKAMYTAIEIDQGRMDRGD